MIFISDNRGLRRGTTISIDKQSWVFNSMGKRRKPYPCPFLIRILSIAFHLFIYTYATAGPFENKVIDLGVKA